MVSNHVSLPKPFASGNISEWFTRFDICCDANEWDDDKRATTLPTLLEGEALAVWLDLSAEEKKSYAKSKEMLVARITPNTFMAIEQFCHAVNDPRGKWSGRTKHGAINGPPGPSVAAIFGPPPP